MIGWRIISLCIWRAIGREEILLEAREVQDHLTIERMDIYGTSSLFNKSILPKVINIQTLWKAMLLRLQDTRSIGLQEGFDQIESSRPLKGFEHLLRPRKTAQVRLHENENISDPLHVSPSSQLAGRSRPHRSLLQVG